MKIIITLILIAAVVCAIVDVPNRSLTNRIMIVAMAAVLFSIHVADPWLRHRRRESTRR